MHFKDLNLNLEKTVDLVYALKFLARERLCRCQKSRLCDGCKYVDICNCWDRGTVCDDIYSAAIKFVESKERQGITEETGMKASIQIEMKDIHTHRIIVEMPEHSMEHEIYELCYKVEDKLDNYKTYTLGNFLDELRHECDIVEIYPDTCTETEIEIINIQTAGV